MHRNKNGVLVNGEGLSWNEWHAAAGINPKQEGLMSLAKQAWEAGEDPIDWRHFMLHTHAECIDELQQEVDKHTRRLIMRVIDKSNETVQGCSPSGGHYEGCECGRLATPIELVRIDRSIDSMIEELSILRDRLHGRNPLDKRSSTKKMRKFLGYAYP